MTFTRHGVVDGRVKHQGPPARGNGSRHECGRPAGLISLARQLRPSSTRGVWGPADDPDRWAPWAGSVTLVGHEPSLVALGTRRGTKSLDPEGSEGDRNRRRDRKRLRRLLRRQALDGPLLRRRYGQLAGGAPRPRLAHVAPRRGRGGGSAEREAQQDAGGASAQLGHGEAGVPSARDRVRAVLRPPLLLDRPPPPGRGV